MAGNIEFSSAFSIDKLLASHDKKSYMDQFYEIVLDNPSKLLNGKQFMITADEFKLFVDKCANILDCVDPRGGNYMIHYVCSFGYLDMLIPLIDRGVNLECTNSNGDTPLHCACANEDIAKYLMNKGANVNCVRRGGQRPIHIACKLSSFELVKYLVNYKADVNCADEDGCHPIHIACDG
jgi:Ankyrin repeats (many copies)